MFRFLALAPCPPCSNLPQLEKATRFCGDTEQHVTPTSFSLQNTNQIQYTEAHVKRTMAGAKTKNLLISQIIIHIQPSPLAEILPVLNSLNYSE